MTISSKMNEKPEPGATVENACNRPRLVDAFRQAHHLSSHVTAVHSWILQMQETGRFPTPAELEVFVLALGELSSESSSIRYLLSDLLDRENGRRESAMNAARDVERLIGIATSA